MSVHAFGLPNLGSTCYFNSILQGLISCPKFNETVLANRDLMKTQTALAIYDFVYRATNGTNPNPQLVKDALTADLSNTSDIMQLRFGQGQECAYEAYTFLIDKMDCKPVSTLFTCRVTNTITCTNCKYELVHKDLLTSIEYSITKSSSNKPFISNLLSNSERLDDYKCDRCKEKTCISNAKYTMVPDIMVITLPKYLPTQTIVDLPLEFKIPRINGGTMDYFTVANIEHAGSRYGGHYWCRAERIDGYYELNDSSYSKIADIKNTSATFISFYIK